MPEVGTPPESLLISSGFKGGPGGSPGECDGGAFEAGKVASAASQAGHLQGAEATRLWGCLELERGGGEVNTEEAEPHSLTLVGLWWGRKQKGCETQENE